MLAEALAEAQGDPARHTVRAETLFAEASRKQLPRKSSRKGPWKLRGRSRAEGLLFLKKSIRNKNQCSDGSTCSPNYRQLSLLYLLARGFLEPVGGR